MRQIQRRCRQKQREEVESAPVPVKALWKSEKYEAVPSRLAEYLHVSEAGLFSSITIMFLGST